MAEITKIGSVPAPTWVTYAAGAGNIIGGPSRSQLHIDDSKRVGSGYLAGEAIGPWDAVYLYTPAGATVPQVFRSFADTTLGTRANGASSLQSARVAGFADAQAQAGEAVTILGLGVEAIYTTVALSGSVFKDFYVSGITPGALTDTAVSVNNVIQPAVAQYLGDGRIRASKN